MLEWSTAAPAIGSAFLASAVEIVEAFTIVLAVATLQGWRPAVAGTACALATLALIVLVLGPVLGNVPLHMLQLVIGVLLLLFGIGWLRKASLRAAGVLPLHDETAIFAAQMAALDAQAQRHLASQHWIAGIAAYKAVLLEGLEVVFIVIAVGAGRGLILPASLGALAACAVVLAIGVAVHRPLSRVPENTLKFGVGVMLSSFGVFWTGEALGIAWPGADLSLFAFAGLFLGAGLVAAKLARTPRRRGSPMTILKAVVAELFGMFLSDVRLTFAILAVVLLAAAVTRAAPPFGGAILLFCCLGVLIVSVISAARRDDG